MAEYYDEISDGYEELHKEEQLKKINQVMPRILSMRPHRVLDVGCGPGFFFDFMPLSKENKVGIDPSGKLIELAKQRNNGTYFTGKAEELPFKNESFDLVVSFTAIQNFNDIKKGLEEMKRVGKNAFILTFLKRSEKKDAINKLINETFRVKEAIEEEKDLIVICE